MKKNKNILVGICAGIASYKTCEMVRILVKNGHNVKIVMTESAAKFVSPLVFQTLSNNPVYIDSFALAGDDKIKHISLGGWADVCVVAPLTANTLSKIACGICDNLLTTILCSLPRETKVLLAPAMNENMWKNPEISENTRKLSKSGKYIVMPPQKGELACGTCGEGRMPEPQEIVKQLQKLL